MTRQGCALLFYSDALVDEKEDADTAMALTTPQKHGKTGIQNIIPNIVGRIPCRKEGEPSGSHQHEQFGEMVHQIESMYKRIITIQNIA